MRNRMKSSKKKSIGKRILKGLMFGCLGIILIFVIAGVGVYSAVNSINKEHKPNETVIGEGAKTALLIYQPSLSGKAKKIAMSVAETMADHGYKVAINLPSDQITYDWEDFDVIAYGSPVYVGKVSPVLMDYVKSNPIEQKKILIFAVGSVAAPEISEIDEMASWVNPNNDTVKMKCVVSDEDAFFNFVETTLTDWDD